MADTKISALAAAAAAAAANELAINEAGTSKKLTVAQIAAYLFARISGTSGAAGEYKTLMKLAADSADNTNIAPNVVMTVTGVGAGTWHFKFTVIYQTAGTGTGIALTVNHTGTTGQFSSWLTQASSIATAANGIGATLVQAAAGNAGDIRPNSVKNTLTFATVGVVSANTDVMAVIEGIIVVTVSGSLELKMGTEVATSAVRLMADSCLELTKIG